MKGAPQIRQNMNQEATQKTLFLTTILGIGVPVLGTWFLNAIFRDRSWFSLPFHSTIEVAGAMLGLLLAFLILQSTVAAVTTRRLWIACALISMAVLDIFHSCVPAGVSFVWLHSLAVVAGGCFFALVWFPEKEISRPGAWASAGTVLLATVFVGFFFITNPTILPAMMLESQFTSLAGLTNFLPSGLILLAALNFAVRYYKERQKEELLLLLLCILFGMAGILFFASDIWEASWWFWHVLRLCGYLFSFWLAMLFYRDTEKKLQDKSLQFQSTVQRIARAAETIADGNLDIEVEAGEGQGLLAKSINRMTQTLRRTFEAAEAIAGGNMDIEVEEKGPHDILAKSINHMTQTLRDASEKNAAQAWLKDGQAGLNDRMRGEQEMAELGRNIVTYLAKYLKAQIGAIYLAEDNQRLRLVGAYAFRKRKGISNVFEFGEGLVGQAALEKESILITEVPDDYLAVGSGLGETPPRQILVFPFLYEKEVKGVIELGSLSGFSDLDFEFLSQSAGSISIGVVTSMNRRTVRELLEKTQAQAEELQAREEELRNNNEILEKQAKELRQSEGRLKVQQVELEETNEKLQAQQEELRVANEELETKTDELQESARIMSQKNKELDRARNEIEIKARDLEVTSKYKSEFLANMSHELRTPLNSLLILSKILEDNKGGNLDRKQIDFARTIHESGVDLLNLINEILDLSKIEAGKMDISVETVFLKDLLESLRKKFSPMADTKGVEFRLDLSPSCPDRIRSDPQKVSQILKNLLSNAFKFTEQGSVSLSIRKVDSAVDLSWSGLSPDHAVAFVVSDTGIGISPDQRQRIFEAFQQADGTIRRKFGGTGLGLSISRELAKILGGDLRLENADGDGSEFTLFLPEESRTAVLPLKPARFSGTHPSAPEAPLEDPGPESQGSSLTFPSRTLPALTGIDNVVDDRRKVVAGDRSILIIEDDPKFARILCDLARDRGFKCLIAENGETGLHFADYYMPSGIILDIGLPGIDGWTVMERLKENLKTRHIPVQFISASDGTFRAMKRGAVGYLTKPVSLEKMIEAFNRIEQVVDRPVKELLVIEDDDVQRMSIVELIGNGDVRTTTATGGEDARNLLKSKRYDCVILDLRLPDMSGVDLLEAIRTDERNFEVPIIVYTGQELNDEERAILDQYAESLIVKGVRSPERLLDDTALFLHRVEENLPEEKKRVIRMLHDQEAVLKGKTVLMVDDDMRNVYALSHVLEEKEIHVIVGKNGRQGLERLAEHPETNIVLMDIMMPEMDGYEAMKKIRQQERFRDLPIIALTAKAMKGDRSKCIEAGASDYLSKPVDPIKLLSMLRVWLYQ